MDCQNRDRDLRRALSFADVRQLSGGLLPYTGNPQSALLTAPLTEGSLRSFGELELAECKSAAEKFSAALLYDTGL